MTRGNNLTKRSRAAAAKFIVPAGMYLEPINDFINDSDKNSDSCSDDEICATKQPKPKRVVGERSKKKSLLASRVKAKSNL